MREPILTHHPLLTKTLYNFLIPFVLFEMHYSVLNTRKYIGSERTAKHIRGFWHLVKEAISVDISEFRTYSQALDEDTQGDCLHTTFARTNRAIFYSSHPLSANVMCTQPLATPHLLLTRCDNEINFTEMIY